MITTTAGGRTWHFSHGLGRPTNEINGNTGGYRYPVSVAVAPGDILFVLSRGRNDSEDTGRIGKTTLDELHIGDFARKEFIWPVSIALSNDGAVYCSDEYENCIAYFDPEAIQPYPGWDPDGERLGQWGEKGSAEGQLDGPAGIEFDREDNIYVVDSRNDRVQKFTGAGEFLAAWGSSGDGYGEFNRPWGITIDGNGDVYVADWGNSRVRKFSPDGAYLMSFGSDGSDGGDLNHPADVAVDSEGDVYVADWGNRRVQIYQPNGDILAAFEGDAVELSKAGTYIMGRDPGTIKAFRQVKDITPMGRFQRPTAIEVDAEDRIIIADACGRLQVYAKDKQYVAPELKQELES
jgi:DNA-binding beta-propeller fold protein YncE